MSNTYFMAVDIGASSGRTILGKIKDGKLEIEEFTRFSNPLMELNNHYYWNILSLYEAIIDALKKASKEEINLSSIGIDTWGVDFVGVDSNNEIVGLPYSYRDPHTIGAPEELFKKMPRKTVYEATGIQIMNFNSLFQFFALQKNKSSMLNNADKFMFMPDALGFMLTGNKVTEYTIASTSQMLNAYTRQFEDSLLATVGLNQNHFNEVVMPGSVIGHLSESITKQTGIASIPVIAVAGHDTASAVASVPAQDKNFAYLSSGTWSLMGIEVDSPIINDETYKLNFTNEGGVDGSIRFLKNICGMWLLEQCRKEWDANLSYSDLINMALASEQFACLINPDDSVFQNPSQMTKTIADYCLRTGQNAPKDMGQFVRCIFESLALRYKQVMGNLKELSPFAINRLHVIGGGSKNNMLNQFIANALDMPIVTGPSEATAIGNIMVQAKALGLVNNLPEMRKIISNSIVSETFYPENAEEWQKAYLKFNQIIK